jgi:hypothetical protein
MVSNLENNCRNGIGVQVMTFGRKKSVQIKKFHCSTKKSFAKKTN